MHSQNIKSLLSTLLCVATLFVSLGAAAPAADTSATAVQHSKGFRLKSRSLTAPKAFDGLYVTTYHIGAAINYAVLVQKSKDLKGIVMQINGTKSEIQHNQADLIYPLPQGFAWPWIVETVTADNGTTTYPVQISVTSEGTKGMFIDQGILKYFNPLSGGWYACENPIGYGSGIQIYWKLKFNATPDQCEDVELVAQYV